MSENRFPKRNSIRADLLAWYDQNARRLPWRTAPHETRKGITPDPYHIWLSEVMLQQTTVVTVIGYFEKFLSLWPDVAALAAADEEDVLKAWAGLGYYSRARNLKKCADMLVADHGGRFPEEAALLRRLPGIGAYTSAAISAIAFGRAEAVVDGNIERIISRLALIETPLPTSKPEIRQYMGGLVPDARAGDFVQAMMDLGAAICTPRNPQCSPCPINRHCKAAKTKDPQRYPLKAAGKAKPEREGAAFVAINNDGAILLEKRGSKGLLAAMSQVPSSAWSARVDGEIGIKAAPFAADWKNCGTIRHTFTHFHLTLHVYVAKVGGPVETNGWWSKDVESEALPTVFRKAINKVMTG